MFFNKIVRRTTIGMGLLNTLCPQVDVKTDGIRSHNRGAEQLSQCRARLLSVAMKKYPLVAS